MNSRQSRLARLRRALRKQFAATAQAEYTSPGGWTGSKGLKSTTILAPTKHFAEQKARAFYKQEWLRERGLTDELVKLHIVVMPL